MVSFVIVSLFLKVGGFSFDFGLATDKQNNEDGGRIGMYSNGNIWK